MFMENCTLVVEKRNANGKGECTITAPYTKAGKKHGYVFNNCTIENYAEKYNLGRAQVASLVRLTSTPSILTRRLTPIAGLPAV